MKLVIYDFDQTITCDHLYYELDGGQEDELKKMSDDKLFDVFGGIDATYISKNWQIFVDPIFLK